MAQISEIYIRVACPRCGNSEYQDVSVAIAGTGADDGGITEGEDGVTDCACSACGKAYRIALQCFADVCV